MNLTETMRKVLRTVGMAVLFLCCTALAVAQTAGVLQGTIADPQGSMLPRANISITADAGGKTVNVVSDEQGHFTAPSLAPGSYTVVASAPGFASVTRKTQVAASTPAQLSITLPIASSTAVVQVEADATNSVAAALAPMDAVLEATSARTEINQSFISNFTSPIADYGEIVAMAPGTFTVSQDGVGLGQSKTYFRGFPDGDYDIDFDGVPFYDTNSPTHHSWAFFPAQSIGSVDFDRSPGTASTIGPTPFGGSIHLLSRDLSPLNNVRFNIAGGSFNTYLYDAAYDSGSFGPAHKLNLTMDIHHMQSHGWQSLNNQNQNAGDIKMEYKISDKFVLSGYSGVVWVDANTPNFSATRCQMYGAPTDGSYSCYLSGTSGPLYPFTGQGVNFLLTNNTDPLLYLDTQWNYYHVPTDFEYVNLHKEFAKNWVLDFKPYTYNYDNSEKYSNAVPITDNVGQFYAPLNTTAPGCQNIVAKKGVYAEPCGVDKYNSYRKYGETSQLSQVSKYGVFRAGMWYEWANTNRHQYPSDPTLGWKDQTLPNFAETFVTDSYEPFVEFAWHATSKLTVTPGIKFAYYTIGTKQFADNGKTVGCFVSTVCNPAVTSAINPNAFISNGGSYFASLPSGSLNYRIRNNWSVYFQGATGSIVPPSSVFDYNVGTTGTPITVETLPQQQKNTTYQAGTVVKLKYITADVDYFHIHFDNSYSSYTDNNNGGEPVYFAQPASVSQGFEFESNISLTHGLGVYINDSYVNATYTGATQVSCISGATGCTSTTAKLPVTVPTGQWVAGTPSNIETEGVTYQHKAWDASFFDKRIGPQYLDVSAAHNQYQIPSFSFANMFVNYTFRTGGRFDQTKLRLTMNNLFNSNAVNGVTFSNSITNPSISANGTTYANPFVAVTPIAISGQDNVAVLAGRSIMLSLTFGLNPKGR